MRSAEATSNNSGSKAERPTWKCWQEVVRQVSTNRPRLSLQYSLSTVLPPPPLIIGGILGAMGVIKGFTAEFFLLLALSAVELELELLDMLGRVRVWKFRI